MLAARSANEGGPIGTPSPWEATAFSVRNSCWLGSFMTGGTLSGAPTQGGKSFQLQHETLPAPPIRPGRSAFFSILAGFHISSWRRNLQASRLQWSTRSNDQTERVLALASKARQPTDQEPREKRQLWLEWSPLWKQHANEHFPRAAICSFGTPTI